MSPSEKNDGPSQIGRADLSNWRTAPFNRWAFRNIREIIPCATIERGDGAPWALPTAGEPLQQQFRLQLPDGSELSLDGFLRATATDGLVILRDGRIVYEFYDHGNAEHVPHILMSATKSIVGLLAGILQEKGALDLTAPVATYVPEIADTAYRGATIRHLLDMRAGVVLDEPQARAYAAASNWEPADPGEEPTDLHAFFASLTAPHRDHGGPFAYVSANTDLLGWAIERATGQSFAALLSDLFWTPLGAEDEAYLTLDRAGAPRCTGGLCATARDLARIGQLLVQDGRREPREVVPGNWIDDIARNGDREAWRKGEFANAFGLLDMHYRSGWYVLRDEPQVLFAMGIHGQNLFVDRKNRIVVAKLSSQHDPVDVAAVGLTRRALFEIRRCLSAGPV